MKKRGCTFCDFNDKKVIIYEDNTVFAVISKRPINKYHVLIIPTQHYELFVDLPDDVASHIFVLAKQISAAVRKVCNPDAISHLSDDDIHGIGQNLIAHYKFHIIPRYKNDKVEIDWHREKDPGVKVRANYANEIKDSIKKLAGSASA